MRRKFGYTQVKQQTYTNDCCHTAYMTYIQIPELTLISPTRSKVQICCDPSTRAVIGQRQTPRAVARSEAIR